MVKEGLYITCDYTSQVPPNYLCVKEREGMIINVFFFPFGKLVICPGGIKHVHKNNDIRVYGCWIVWVRILEQREHFWIGQGEGKLHRKGEIWSWSVENE